MTTSEQIRAARALLRWEQKDLAYASRVSLPSIKRLEATPGHLAAQARTIEALRAAIETAGVIFVEENGEGPGVRLRKRLLAPAEIDQKIEELDAQAAALDLKGGPSPERALNQMKKALIENEQTKLRNKRAKLAKRAPKRGSIE